MIDVLGCEASREVDYTGPAPVVILCGKPGYLRFNEPLYLPWGVYLCDECYEAREAKKDGHDA